MSIFGTATTAVTAVASRRVLPFVGTQQIPLEVKPNQAIAIGGGAGNSVQGTGSVAIGYQAGFTGQKDYSVAIGYQAGFTGHGTGSIAIGFQAGFRDASGPNSIAIGTQAGQFGLGSNSIAIGNLAGPTGAAFSNNIILNAQGSALNPNTGSAFYAAPIRNALGGTTQTADISSVLFYNSTTQEITYGSRYLSQVESFAGPTLIGSGTLVSSGSGITLANPTRSGTYILSISTLDISQNQNISSQACASATGYFNATTGSWRGANAYVIINGVISQYAQIYTSAPVGGGGPPSSVIQYKYFGGAGGTIYQMYYTYTQITGPITGF
jgi:hypothetical protein